MDKSKPTIYILHGDDHLGIRGFIDSMILKMGDAVTAQMNISRLSEGVDPESDIQSACLALPIFSDRRMVIVENAEEYFRNYPGTARSGVQKTNSELLPGNPIVSFFESVPHTTAMVLIVADEWIKEKGSWGWRNLPPEHWMMDWIRKHPEQTFYRCFPLPRGKEMGTWVIDQVKKLGGAITPAAAQALTQSTGNDTQMGFHEIEKLLSFVNYQRTIEVEDVNALTSPLISEDVFAMADAIGRRDSRNALKALHGLLLESTPEELMGMITRQIRLLIIVNEALHEGKSPADISGMIRLPAGITQKYIEQARGFQQGELVNVYQRFLEIDESNKIGKIPIEIALDTLIVSFSSKR